MMRNTAEILGYVGNFRSLFDQVAVNCVYRVEPVESLLIWHVRSNIRAELMEDILYDEKHG